MPKISYEEAGAVGRGVAEGFGKITEQQKQEQMIALNHQWDIEAFNRAKSWEIEKLEIRSKLDFEREERRRQQLIDEGNAINKKLDQLVESGELETTSSFYQAKKVEAELKSQGIRTNEAPLSMLAREQGGSILGKLPEETAGVSTPDNPLGLNIVSTAAPVKQPLSQEVKELEAAGKFRVISPDGDEETITSDKWPEYKNKGYILADIVELRQRKARVNMASRQFRGFNY